MFRAVLRRAEMRDIGIYGFATGLAAVLTLVLTRELWRGLTPAEFGVWALVDPTLLPIASLVLFGVDHAIVKQLRMDREPLAVIVGGLLAASLPSFLASLLLGWIVASLVFHLAWTNALLLTLSGEALILMVQTALRASGAVKTFAAVLLARNLLYLGVLLVLLSERGGQSIGIGEVFFARGGCVLLVALTALPVLRPVFRLSLSRYRDALRYGMPLLLTTFVYAVSDVADRWILAQFAGVVSVGVYSLHLKVAAILAQAIVIPFGLWFPPERFKHLDDADGGHRFFVRTAALLAIVCATLAGGVWLARRPVLALVAPGSTASPVVLACCLAGVTSLAMSQALNVGLLTPGQTVKNVWCNGLAAAVTGLVALAVVPWLGIYGAAASRLAGGLTLVGVTAVWSNRLMPVPFPFRLMLGYFGCMAAMAAALDLVSADHDLAGLAAAFAGWAVVSAAGAALFWARVIKAKPQAEALYIA